MRDRLYMVLAFVGFIILAVVTVKNYDISQDEKQFAVGDFYTPRTVKSRVDSSVELYAQMSGSRQRSCPQPEMSKASSIVKNIEGLNSSNERNKYGAVCMFVPNYAMVNGKTTGADISPVFIPGKDGISDIQDQLNISSSDALTNEGEVTLGDLWNLDGIEPVELVAPFNFEFETVNTTDNNTITIVNNLGACRITFGNVSNWFCAGTPGTTWITGSGTGSNESEWEHHGEQTVNADGSKVNASHLTIAGNTANAEIQGGMSKDVIGYGNSDTTVLIEAYTGNRWKTISIYNFITDHKNS